MLEPTASCPECQAALPPQARFCAQCGARVATSPAPIVGERRPVAILFADLAGFTGLTSQIDAEEVHRLLGRFFEVVDGVVARSGRHDRQAHRRRDDGRVRRAGRARQRRRARRSRRVRHPRRDGRAVRRVRTIARDARRHCERRSRGGVDRQRDARRLHDDRRRGEPRVAPRGARRRRRDDRVGRRAHAHSARDSTSSRAGRSPCADSRTSCRCGACARCTRRSPSATDWSGVRASARGSMRRSRHCEPTGGASTLARARRSGGRQDAARRVDARNRGGGRLRMPLGHGPRFRRRAGTRGDHLLARSLLGLDAASDDAACRAALERALAAGRVGGEHEPFLADLLAIAQSPGSRYDAMDHATRARGRIDALAALAVEAARQRPGGAARRGRALGDSAGHRRACGASRSDARPSDRARAHVAPRRRSGDDAWPRDSVERVELDPLSTDEALELARRSSTRIPMSRADASSARRAIRCSSPSCC